ncbi:hypothetical protein [Niemeyer virus]|uniref:Uncharacterized protein n=1 Tax=Acanthamoeba polyphaga mimivirus Kroon TaxID=3069720 RepID=A0A0G2Y2C1_9VIRU|nr:hypothetical protein QJ850_gp796 [Acanthamoeba polyphaga mimivirus]AKI79903.1 hypothetical protein [Acanthamoeba polyphaga mimivirus Kroon]ALR83736.1 hypothetical protein [Niemeyer virus]
MDERIITKLVETFSLSQLLEIYDSQTSVLFDTDIKSQQESSIQVDDNFQIEPILKKYNIRPQPNLTNIPNLMHKIHILERYCYCLRNDILDSLQFMINIDDADFVAKYGSKSMEYQYHQIRKYMLEEILENVKLELNLLNSKCII